MRTTAKTPTVRQLTYLVAVAEEQHFGNAAGRVHVTQPTLSAQFANLEEKLGVILVERRRTGAVLTPVGRQIAERARRLLRDVEDLVELAEASTRRLTGTIRFGVPSTLGPYLLHHIVPALHAEYPDLKLYVREALPNRLQDELSAGRLDLVLTPLPVLPDGIQVEQLFREPLLLATARDHRLAKKTMIERNDLRGETVLALEPGYHLYEQVRRICEEFGATLLRDYEGTSLDTLRQMVGMGVGVAFLPALYVRSEIGNRGEVAVLPLQTRKLSRDIALAWRSSSTHTVEFLEIAALFRSVVGRGQRGTVNPA